MLNSENAPVASPEPLPHAESSPGRSGNPFVGRFRALDHTARDDLPRPSSQLLRGNYGQWKSFIEDAVRENAQPCPELIWANTQLSRWEAHLLIGKVSSFPMRVGSALTDICNARCVFCAYAPERIDDRKINFAKIQRADWLKFSASFRPNGNLGEPFAHPRAVDIFRAIREQAPYIHLESITNGSLLRRREIELVVGNFNILYVSVNASSKETYERTMPPLIWERLIDNLTALKEAKERLGTQLPSLQAGYVVSKHNLDDLPALPGLLHRLGFTEVRIFPMQPPPRCNSSVELLTPDDSIFTVPERADAVFRETEREIEKYGLKLRHPLYKFKAMKQQDRRPAFLRAKPAPVEA